MNETQNKQKKEGVKNYWNLDMHWTVSYLVQCCCQLHVSLIKRYTLYIYHMSTHILIVKDKLLIPSRPLPGNLQDKAQQLY